MKSSGRLPPTLRKRISAAVVFLLPCLICLWLHRDGLRAWFQADDFAWLGLTTEYHNARTFWAAVFRPASQGNIRPLSERLFFFASWHWFGWNALPARLVVMATQCANLLLLSSLVKRLSGSALAAFAAPILWAGNAALVEPMTWTSAYAEILCAFFLLAALTFWIRFTETGQLTDYAAQTVVFLVGFGVLEVNLIYPALAAAWAWFYRRDKLVWTLPLFAVSALFYLLHTRVAPTAAAGPYHPEFSLAILTTFAQYWKLALIPPYGWITVQPVRAAALLISATIGIALFLWSEFRTGRYGALYCACWFVIVLAPLLPFRNHVTHYYLTIPLAGLAGIGGMALARRWVPAALVLALYAVVQLPSLAAGERWMVDRSLSARALLMGVRQVHAWEPAKAILLTDVSQELYGVAIADQPFRLIPDAQVYLAPESSAVLTGLASNLAPASHFILPAEAAKHALLEGRLVVYSAAASPLVEVTAPYMARLLGIQDVEEPRLVNAGSPLLTYLFGPEWDAPKGAYRGMHKHATLRIAGPGMLPGKLFVTGLAVLGPAILSVAVNGSAVGTASLGPGPFTREFALPAQIDGKPSIVIALDAERAQRPLEEPGLFFESFTVSR